MTNSTPTAKRPPRKKRKPSLSTGSLKSMLVAGSAAATFLGAMVIGQVDGMNETAVPPQSSITITEPMVIDPVGGGKTAVIINNDPIPQVVIPEPITNSQSSR